MEASCSCNCTCSGTWVTPMVSVPVHDISFGGDNAMHCSQSSLPRHQLGCNLPSLNRSPRSTDNYNDPNDSNQIILIISAFVIYTVVVILCTLMVSKRLKRCAQTFCTRRLLGILGGSSHRVCWEPRQSIQLSGHQIEKLPIFIRGTSIIIISYLILAFPFREQLYQL